VAGALALGVAAGVGALAGMGSPAPAPAPAAPAEPAKFSVDPVHSSMFFRISHLGIAPFYGRFDKISGNFTWDQDNSAASSFAVEIDTASVNTNVAKRDDHLRSPDFFNAKEHPAITFKSTGLTKAGDAWELAGDLTISGKTRPIKAALKFGGEKNVGKEMGGIRAGFDISFAIKRTDFGVNYGVDAEMLGDDVQIMLGLEGTRQ
jgi:polyisoprenoid-binding protein YceI